MYKTNNKYEYPYDPSSKKYICPKCGRKTFVLFHDSSGNIISPEVGKCDRQNKCGWIYYPWEYLKDRNPLNTSSGKNARTSSKRSRPKPIPPDFISPELFSSTLKGYERNSLMRFLHSFFDSLIGADEVDRVAMEYAIGTANQFGGSPIFWQVDENGRIRSGKIMGYDAVTGKRVKNPKPQLQWVHSLMKEQLPDFRLQQCYFGSHRVIKAERFMKQLNEERTALNPDKEVKQTTPVIGLFESEKACLIVAMALAWGDADNLFIPVSCGGCENFNPTEEKKRDPFDGIRLLKNRRVVIFPDEGKFDKWMQKAQALKGYASEVYVSTVMEKSLHPHRVECEYQQGDALDDLILRYFIEGKDVAHLINTSYGYLKQYKVV